MRKFRLYFLPLYLFSFIISAQNYRSLSLEEGEKRLLPQFGFMIYSPIVDITLEELHKQRKQHAETPWPKLNNKDSVIITQKEISGLNEGDPKIPITLYQPLNAENLPVFIWFHGGGFIFGTPKWDHQRCADFAVKGKVIVINVDYRLAPENPFPAALHDAYATLLWVEENAKSIGGNGNLIAVGGGSAGAGLSGSLAQYTRDKKGPKISLEVLEILPGDFKTNWPSAIEFKRVPGLKSEDFPIMEKFYIGENGNPDADYVLPGNIKDVSNLPPTVIFVAGTDPLRDSGMAYADRLIKAGNFTELHVFAGYAHGMPLPGSMDIAIRMMKQFLRE